MTDHQLTDDANARYLARRAYRRPLLRSPALRGSRADSPNAELPAPIVHGTLSGGLGRDQLLGDFATVQITVGPWDYPNMTDIIVLHWGEQWTQELPVTDTNGAQLLSIPGVDIAGDPLGDGDHYNGEGTHAVWYEIRTASGTLKPSATTQVVVKTARPGGQDPRPDTPVNDNLIVPDADPNPVKQDATEVTFSVKPWKNVASDDKLVLVVAGILFPFPAITDVTAIQTLTLPAEQVAAIGGGSKTQVSYQITDRVGNLSGFAPFLTLNVWMETGDLLEMIELLGDDGAFIEGAINPAMSKGKAIVPRYTDWAIGESVTVVLEGTASDGQEYTTTLDPRVWKPTDYYLDFELPNAALLALAGGIVRVHYQTSTNKVSFRRIYMVSPLPETGLPPVTVRGEQGGELPLDGIEGDYVNIVVPDSEALVDFARVTLTMDGSGADGPVHEEEVHNIGEGEGHAPLTFAWAKERVARLLDTTATFRYSVRTLDAGHASARGIRDSEPHDLLIRQSGGAELKAPIVHDLVDDVLSPTRPSVRLTVPGGAESKPGRKVTTTVVGRTTVSRTNTIFDQGESLAVDFAGWPALNDGASAIASYVIEGVSASAETRFRVGGSSQPFTLDDSLVQLKVGDDYRREASGGTPPYTYTSNATAVAVPQANGGLIRGARAGSASISVKDSAQGAGQYPVVVSADNPFDISPDPVSIDTDTDYTRNATGGTPPYSYSSSAPSIVRVPESGYGLVRGVAPGNATIIARDQANASGSYQVTVRNPVFQIDPDPVTLTGITNYTRHASGGQLPYTYMSSDPGVVAVTHPNQGFIQSVSDGSATITAQDSAGAYGTYPVNVTGIAPPKLDFGSNQSLVTADYHIARGRPPLNPPPSATYTRVATGGKPPYTYSSSNTNVATIDANGKVRASGNGAAVLTVRDANNATATHSVTVSGAAVYIQDPSWGFTYFVLARDKCTAAGGRLPNSRQELWALQNTHVPEGRPDQVLGWRPQQTWTSESATSHTAYCVSFADPGNTASGSYNVDTKSVICRLLP